MPLSLRKQGPLRERNALIATPRPIDLSAPREHSALARTGGYGSRRSPGRQWATRVRLTHEHVGSAARDVLAFATVALRLHRRLAFGRIAHSAAIASPSSFTQFSLLYGFCWR